MIVLKFGLPHITKPDLDIGFNMDDLDRFRRQIRQPAIQNLAVDVLTFSQPRVRGNASLRSRTKHPRVSQMAAIELRRIAAQPSDITNDVLRVAEKLEDEAADMERRGFGAR